MAWFAVPVPLIDGVSIISIRDPYNGADVRLFLHYGDMSSAGSLLDLIYTIKPYEIYHLAAQSHVRVSFDLPEYTVDVTGVGTSRILEAIRKSGIKTRFYQASSSEMFGRARPPQNERTPFEPQSPYAAAKVLAYWNNAQLPHRLWLICLSWNSV